MTRRLATICLMTTFLIGLTSPPVQSEDTEDTRATLKGISALSVLIQPLPDGAKTLGLTKEAIQTDVELKLRLAGIRIVTMEEALYLPGDPYLYVNVNVTADTKAANIDVELCQDAVLARNAQLAHGVTTWNIAGVVQKPDAQYIRDRTKDFVDSFLNAWLSVNPKK